MSETQPTAEELAKLPPELRSNADGTYPALTPKLIKSLRGKYFTVKHVLLTNCGHRLDMINQPKNNCENCWFQWFNTHPQLIETADQFFRVHGKGPLIGMRGEKFFKMFVRYMATIIHFMKEEEAIKAAKAAQEKANEPSSEHVTDGASASGIGNVQEGEAVARNFTAVVTRGQEEGNRGADQIEEQRVRDAVNSKAGQ